MKSKLLILLLLCLVILGLLACIGYVRKHHGSTDQYNNEEQAVRQVVTQFGVHLKNVPLAGSIEIVTDAIRKEYSPLVTPALLSNWLANPQSAPGRPTSSPWPVGITIQSVSCSDRTMCTVAATVPWLTSVEVAQGGTALTQSIVIGVLNQAGEWRISSYTIQSDT